MFCEFFFEDVEVKVMAVVKERLFPVDRKNIDDGSLIAVVNTKEFNTFGSNKFHAARPAKYKMSLYENCIKVMIDSEGDKQYHYVYHEDIFNEVNYKYYDTEIEKLQWLILNVWKNPNYNGYITSNGIETRAKLLKQPANVSKL